ncbi:MAG: hypothetical protein ABIQ72_05415 [Usitatibacter sp.]
MDQIKVAADLSKEETVAQETTKANDVRTLSDLEMVICGGGDGVVCW